MMWRARRCGRLGVILGAFVSVVPASGWAAAPKKAPDEARLREAEELKGDYERLYRKGKYGEAAALAKRACSILREEHGSEAVEAAQCLHDLGSLYLYQGAYGKAEPLLGQALAIREQARGSTHLDVAASLNNLALLYQNQGAYGKAEPLYERALAIREKALGKDHPEVAVCLNNLASLYEDQGAYGKAESLYKRALTIQEKALGKDHPEIAACLNNLASLFHEQGAYREAEPLFERALDIHEKVLGKDHPHVAGSLNGLAALYQAQGAYDKAEPLYKRALAIQEKALGKDHPRVAGSLNDLASLYWAQGAYGKAQPLYERALAIGEEALGKDHPRVATALNNLATVFQAQGEYGEAEPLYERAMAIREKALGPNHPYVAQTLNNLGFLHEEQGEYREAEPLLKRALTIFEKTLGPDHPDVANSLSNLAFLYTYHEEYGKARPLYERALAIRERALGSEHPDVANSLNNLASLYYHQGDFDRGLELDGHALGIQEINLVRALTVADEPRRLAYAAILSRSLHFVLSFHLRANPEHDAIAKLALTTVLRRKNRVQDLIAQSTTVLRRSLAEDDRYLLDDLSDVGTRVAVLSNRGPGKLTVEAFKQQLDDLERQRDRLWDDLAKHNAIIETLDHPIAIEDVQRALSTKRALVEFVEYVPRHDDAGTYVRKHEAKPPPRYAAYIVFPDRFDWVDLGLAAPIDEHVKDFRKALQTKQTIPTDLYDAVMRPIVDKLGTTRRLIIAPAGALSLIPFGALYDGDRYLVEKYELRYVTTGRDLLDPPASPPVTTTPVTIVANPVGAGLPDAETEANFLEGFFPDTHVLRGKQATETNVRTVERPLILHMATHGFFGEARNERDNSMFRSGLYLADIEQVEVDRERDDGQLTAYEVSGMDLRGTQLVVLSACETGMGAVTKAEGKELMSEGVSGLRRAFAMAGARTTVMSLWEVSGVTAQTTMEAYYRKLAEGQGPGEAMQAVQLEMLRTKEHAHPKDWAVFVVSGDDTPMVFPEGEEPRVEEPKQPGPPPVRRPAGCAVAAPGSDRDPSVPALLLGFLGLGVLRRRRRA